MIGRMADFRPFTALRYDPSVAGPAADLIAPPYDVVSAADRAALYARSPYNIAHVDFGEERPGDSEADNRYTRARDRIERWRRGGILKRDAGAHIYAYDQEFTVQGRRHRRRAVFGRLRLEPWEEGIVLPHEHTLAAPKADRLKLLQTTRVNLSPIMAMYVNDSGRPLVEDRDLLAPVLDATLENGERHLLAPLSESAAHRFVAAMMPKRLYIADGHHRYETALAYRDELRAASSGWTGEEPENYVLAALVDASDPGLVILPIHRIVAARPAQDAISRLGQYFEVEELSGQPESVLAELMQRLEASARSGTSIGVAGLTPGLLHVLRRKSADAGDHLLPAGHADVWRTLDVNVLHHIVFPTIGIAADPEKIEFTEDHEKAVKATTRPGTMAFLLNPTRVQQVIACADAGERMPQKSTFFYPKLATGVVMYPLAG